MEKFDFNDILIEPAVVSTIESRKDINPFYNGFLPLITAPMDMVVSLKNAGKYRAHKIGVCLPRGEKCLCSNHFESYSLNEMIDMMKNKRLKCGGGSYLIDIANGHMNALIGTIKDFKAKYPNNILMVGNVANPDTYVALSEAGADYIRVGIGNGGGCSTTVHTGVGYPMASLINECYMKSLALDNPAMIVADGGMQNYSDIIKALALGADYVMLGSMLNKCIESSGENYLWGKIRVSQFIAEKLYSWGLPIYKKFRGMSTKEVQKKWGNETLKTSEGVTRFRKVEYTLSQWVENFEDYLRSSMSYSNARNLEEFIGYAKFNRISDNSYLRYKK